MTMILPALLLEELLEGGSPAWNRFYLCYNPR